MAQPHQVGHIIAKTFYARVTAKRVSLSFEGPSIDCQDLLHQNAFSVRGQDLIDQFVSADTWETEEDVTRTELARKLVDAGPLPFTVCYFKMRGQERVLRGRLVEHEDLLGRSMVHDFDVTDGTPLRQVDHRSLVWLVIGGIRYNVKGKK